MEWVEWDGILQRLDEGDDKGRQGKVMDAARGEMKGGGC